MQNPYLLIIDLQEKLYRAMNNKEEILRKTIVLIKGFQLFELPIIITEQVPEKLGPTIKPIKSLIPNIKPIHKSSFSCASNPEFISFVNNIENIDGAVVAGIETHVCVYQTVKDLQKLGQKVEVVADAVTSRNLNDHDVALERIMQEGSFLTTAEMLLFGMQKNAQGTNFKELVALVK